MKPVRSFLHGALLAFLALASTHGFALTLGRLQGAALVGRELDVSVQVQFAPEEGLSASCFDAEVRYGDGLVERSRVSVGLQDAASGAAPRVRITAAARVDDAIVSIDLKTRCGPKTSRHYVLLADVLSESGETSAEGARPPGVTAKVASTTPVATPASSSGSAPDAAGKNAPSVPNPKPAAKPVAKPAAKPVAPAAKVAPQAGDKLAVVSAGPAGASTSAAASSVAAVEALQHRIEAIELWQLKSTAHEDLQKSAERANRLQADIQNLKIISAKNQQNLQTLSAAMEVRDSSGVELYLVGAVGALVVLSLGAVAFVYNRMRTQSADNAPWWLGGAPKSAATATQRQPLLDEPELPAISLPAVLTSTPAWQEATQPFVAKSSPLAQGEPEPEMNLVDLDIDLDAVAAEESFATQQIPVSATTEALPPVDFTHSVPNAIRTINTTEMLDIRQQADFFMALGQHDNAIALLESSVRESVEVNPLVFLDLLKIFHTLGRRNEFEHYREEFNLHFTGRVPPFADFLQEGNGLDSYDDLCQQIVVLWPTEYTIDYLEQCMVRTPNDHPDQGVDLQAFKDLLLLYGVLRRLDQPADSGLIPFSTSRTSHAPITVAASIAGGLPELPVSVEPRRLRVGIQAPTVARSISIWILNWI